MNHHVVGLIGVCIKTKAKKQGKKWAYSLPMNVTVP